ncbi:MAG: OmpH family outer membrane protein [Paludibacteraceae bacterium]|nr:OmpH family outer membrane protein [Paludibacteraceae bacterium]
MKKIIVILMMALPMLASAQKMGYINTQELFTQMPDVKVANAQLDSLNAYYENVLATMQEEYQKKVQDYQQKSATMTDAIRQITEEEIVTIQQRIQTTYETAKQDVQKKQQDLLAPIHEKMAKAIQKVGDAQAYTYILDSSVSTVYVGKDATNIMADVKKELGIK